MSTDEYIEPGEMEEIDSRRAARDEVIVTSLARGRSYEQAGIAAGVSARTVQRRMRDAGFRQRVFALRAQWVSEATGRLIDAASDAINVIENEMRNGERSPDRLRAAQMLLDFGPRFRRTNEYDERLALVEEQLRLATPLNDGSQQREEDTQ